jgi:hypothetical protein
MQKNDDQGSDDDNQDKINKGGKSCSKNDEEVNGKS